MMNECLKTSVVRQVLCLKSNSLFFYLVLHFLQFEPDAKRSQLLLVVPIPGFVDCVERSRAAPSPAVQSDSELLSLHNPVAHAARALAGRYTGIRS